MVMTSPVPESTEKLVNSVESSHPGIIQPVKSFVLKSNDSFASKASGVFNRLSSLENEHSVWMTNNETHESFEADDVPAHASGSTSKTVGAPANDSADTSEIDSTSANDSGKTSEIGSTSANDSGNTSEIGSTSANDSSNTSITDSVADQDSGDTSKTDNVNADDSGDTSEIGSTSANDSGDISITDSVADLYSGDTFKTDNMNVDDSGETTKTDNVDAGDTSKIDDVNADDSGDSSKTDNVNADDSGDTSKTDNFKKPFLPIRRIQKRGTIRKKKNTRIWRKYSLKNVPLTSDSKNAAVAYEFMDELRKKREGGISNETASTDGKITFRKPVKRSLAQSSCSEASSSSTTATENRPNKITCSIRLDHLRDRSDD